MNDDQYMYISGELVKKQFSCLNFFEDFFCIKKNYKYDTRYLYLVSL